MPKKATRDKSCLKCKNRFWPHAKSYHPDYCSVSCHHIHNDYKINCSICKKEFMPKHKNQKCCSKECTDLASGKWFDAYQAENKAIRYEIFKRDDFKCAYCGTASYEGAKLHVDHIYPRELGGGSDLYNLITSCIVCNSKKTSKPLTQEQTLRLWERNKSIDIKSGLSISYDDLKAKFERYFKATGNVVKKAS